MVGRTKLNKHDLFYIWTPEKKGENQKNVEDSVS